MPCPGCENRQDAVLGAFGLLSVRVAELAGVPCMAIMALAMFLLPLSDSFLTLLLASMLAGLGNGFGSGINMTLGADFAPEHERGEFLGVWRLCSDLGSFAGPIVMGYIANTFLLATAFSFAGGLGVVGAFIMVVFVKETLVKDE